MLYLTRSILELGAEMFELLSERGHRVITLSNDEANLMGHEQIGTEHILLGLLREGEGIAANALLALNLNLATARREVESLKGRGDHKTGHIPFSLAAKAALGQAETEAKRLGHNYVGTEHILLALVRDGGYGSVYNIFTHLRIDLINVRFKILDLLAGGHPGQTNPPS